MYEVDERDEVHELSDVPKPDIGAPLPHILADEENLLLAYGVSEHDPDWDGTTVNVVSRETDQAIILVRFQSCGAHFFGPPNDEAFHGHPLASRGLAPYSVYEIRHSSWIRRLERMNAVHPCHDPDLFLSSLRHYIFAFHDSTFECIAEGFTCELLRGSLSSVLHRMLTSLEE